MKGEYNKLLILADIHANLTALRAVLQDALSYRPDAVVLLGDVVDYGMRPNEVIEDLQKLPMPVLANIIGNHEKALLDGDMSQFSSERGQDCNRYTSGLLNKNSWGYIRCMEASAMCSLTIQNKRILAVHATLPHPYWGKFDFPQMKEEAYKAYDYVLMGHSHKPFVAEGYFDVDAPVLRNKKKTVFLNPGSVGQPRNQNPCAQYALLNVSTGQAQLMAVPYAVKEEQKLYPESIDVFYRERLSLGI